MESLSRRSFLRIVGTGTAAGLLGACAPQVIKETVVVEKEVEVEKVVKETIEVEVEKVVEKEVEKVVEVTAAAPIHSGEVIFWGHDQHPMDLAATGFTDKYPEIEWISPHPADRGQKINATMAAGSGCPDLYWAEATEAQDWGCNGLLVDLTPNIDPYRDDYHPLKLTETYIYKTGQYVGWPGDISVSAYYYRPDKFAEAGYEDIDWDALTYDDFCRISSEIAEQGMYTFVFPADGWGALYMFALHQLGGSAVSEDGQEIRVADELGIQAMQIVKQLWDCGGGLDVGWWSAPYWAALQEGTLIGDFAAAWAKGFWEAQIGTAEAGLGIWRLAPFPSGPGIKYRSGVWGGAQLVCPQCAENKENAVEFMKYALGSLEGAALAGSWGIIPSYRPYLESPLFLSAKSPIFGDWQFNQFWASMEPELSTEFYRPAGWGAVSAIVQKEMVPILLGEVSIEDGMERIEELATPDFERTKCSL